MGKDMNIKKGDTVKVIAGQDKGTTGEVLRVMPKENKVVVEGTELMARCLQHEVDHLDGYLYLDRLEKSVRKKAMRELRESL